MMPMVSLTENDIISLGRGSTQNTNKAPLYASGQVDGYHQEANKDLDAAASTVQKRPVIRKVGQAIKLFDGGQIQKRRTFCTPQLTQHCKALDDVFQTRLQKSCPQWQ